MTTDLLALVFAARTNKTNPLERSDEILLSLLPCGRHMAVSGDLLRRILAFRLARPVSRRQLSIIIARLINDHRIPVGTSKASPAGYFLVETNDDRKAAAKVCWDQIAQMIRRARVLSPDTLYGRVLLGQQLLEMRAKSSELSTDEDALNHEAVKVWGEAVELRTSDDAHCPSEPVESVGMRITEVHDPQPA